MRSPSSKCTSVSICASVSVCTHSRRKQFHFGGPNVICTAIAAICAACMNINKASRVKYIPPPPFLRLWY